MKQKGRWPWEGSAVPSSTLECPIGVSRGAGKTLKTQEMKETGNNNKHGNKQFRDLGLGGACFVSWEIS